MSESIVAPLDPGFVVFGFQDKCCDRMVAFVSLFLLIREPDYPEVSPLCYHPRSSAQKCCSRGLVLFTVQNLC